MMVVVCANDNANHSKTPSTILVFSLPQDYLNVRGHREGAELARITVFLVDALYNFV